MNSDYITIDISIKRLDKTQLTKKSSISGNLNTIIIDMEYSVFLEKYRIWTSEIHLIQDVFPELNDDEKEFIISGTTKEEWDDLFGEEEQKHPHIKDENKSDD